MNIWTYWEGPRPPFIDLCLRSMQQAFRDEGFHLVTPETLHDYISPGAIHPNYHNLLDAIGHGNKHMLSGIRADCIRAALLAAHGGWWWDADTVVLGDRFPSPASLLQQFPDADVLYTVWDEPPLRMLNGYVYMKAGCDEAAEWLERINYRLEAATGQVVWAELGEAILTPLLKKSRAAQRVDRSTFLPVDIDRDVAAFFKEGDPLERVRDGTVCFGLNHSYFMYHHADVMDRPWDRDLLVHRLFRCAEAVL